MVRLNHYANNLYSQYGEDGMLAEVLRRMGISKGVCVEFGASDGIACSNTARLWKHGWTAILLEKDQDYDAALQQNVTSAKATYKIAEVTPGTVDALIGRDAVDLISIDIDGDDFAVFCAMKCRTKVLVVEYNRTVPPHIDLVPEAGNNSRFGVGSLTLKNAAEQRGYTLVGLTDANAIFVDTEYASLFDDIEKDLKVLQPLEDFMFLATDGDGRILPLGHNPPWGLAWPQSEARFRPNQDGLLNILAVDQIERLIQAVNSIAIDVEKIQDARSSAMQIALDMRGGYNEELRDRIERELGLR